MNIPTSILRYRRYWFPVTVLTMFFASPAHASQATMLACMDGDTQSCDAGCGTGSGRKECVAGRWMPCQSVYKQCTVNGCPGDAECEGGQWKCYPSYNSRRSCTACSGGGTQACYSNFTFGPCQPSTKGSETTSNATRCDKCDNDLSGVADDFPKPCAVPGKYGPCASGTGTCSGTTYVCQQTIQPTAETCDAQDNNCDAVVDNMGQVSCGIGGCRRVFEKCINGALQQCEPGTPESEVCDGVDNDCDYSEDEGFGTLSCGVGECVQQLPRCDNGVLRETCGDGVTGSPEICDGKDNDCNGSIDEGSVCRNDSLSCTCVPKAPVLACGERICGPVADGCGGTIDCGTCGVGLTCNAEGTCL